MTPNERIKAKQDSIILELIKLQSKLQELEELAKYLNVDLFVTESDAVHSRSASISVKLALMSQNWNESNNEVTG